MSAIIKVIETLVSIFCGKPAPQETSQQPQWHPQQQQAGQAQYPPSQYQAPVPPQPEHHKPHHKPHHSGPQQYSHTSPSSPSHPASYPHTPHPDPNQVNQHDSHYTDLRKRANEEGDAMARCFQQSHEAYARGDGAGAKELSNQGKDHQRKMEQLNKQAADWIFIENNKDSQPGEIDLHGLYVKEAIARTDSAIEDAKRRGGSEIHLIVGKGLHSQGGVAKIKPAIEELMQKHQLVAELDPHNAGVLIVQLGGHRDRAVGSDEIARRLDRDDEGCIVM